MDLPGGLTAPNNNNAPTAFPGRLKCHLKGVERGQ